MHSSSVQKCLGHNYCKANEDFVRPTITNKLQPIWSVMFCIIQCIVVHIHMRALSHNYTAICRGDIPKNLSPLNNDIMNHYLYYTTTLHVQYLYGNSGCHTNVVAVSAITRNNCTGPYYRELQNFGDSPGDPSTTIFASSTVTLLLLRLSIGVMCVSSALNMHARARQQKKKRGF